MFFSHPSIRFFHFENGKLFNYKIFEGTTITKGY